MSESRTVASQEILRRGKLAGPLYWLGADLPPERLRVAVVGSRKATQQQLDHAYAFGRDLAELGVIVVSGGALGVDTHALQGALAAQGPAWVAPLAVVPASVDAPFPKQNQELFDQIVARGGALCSKFAADTVHCRGRFLARNDLLVQLVDAVIAVCADRPSGTLHCATSAWRREVPVFAVPWSPDAPHTAGSQALLFAGARALWPGEPLRQALGTLQREPLALFKRSAELPLWPAAEAAAPTKAPQTFDAVGNGWPCYAPDALAHGLSHGDPPGCDAGLVARLRADLVRAGAQGLTVDELAATTQSDRTAVAAALLNWTLHGGLKRVAGSWYALDPAPRL